MRAYLTIVRDAFAAATASKVLYVMVALILVFLIAIAPIGVVETLNYRFGGMDLRDPVLVAERLVREGSKDPATPIGRLWEKLSVERRQRLTDFVEQPEGGANNNRLAEAQRIDLLRDSLTRSFESLIRTDDLIDPEQVDRKDADDEYLELLDLPAERRTSDQTRRLNRLHLDRVFPMEIRRADPTMLRISYLGLIPFKDAGPTRAELRQFATVGIPTLLDKFVLSIGVLVAILFTAGMIPELLEPGSLNLLLSKPVRRSGLFLSKFVGACAFALLNSILFFVGLWLILGVRLGLWNGALLACIPIYLFVFALYYSVASLVGLMTRSTILSIVASILFWLFCFLIGIADWLAQAPVEMAAPRRLAVSGERMIRFSPLNHAEQSADGGEWTEALGEEIDGVPPFLRAMMPQGEMLGPIWDAPRNRWVGARGGFASVQTPLSADLSIVTASAESEWNATQHQRTPPFLQGIYPLDERSCVLLGRFGDFYRLDYEAIIAPKVEPEGDQADGGDDESATIVVSSDGLSVDGAEAASSDDTADGDAAGDDAVLPALVDDATLIDPSFVDVSPYDRLTGDLLQQVAYDPQRRSFVCYGGGTLVRVDWNGERFEWNPADRMPLETTGRPRQLAYGNGIAYLAFEDHLIVVDLAARTMRRQAWSGARVADLEADPAGSGAAIRDRQGYVWSVAVDGAIRSVGLSGQGTIRAIDVSPEGELWSIDRYNQPRRIDWETRREVESGPSGMSTFAGLYRYVVHPVYWLSPKPGEFYRLVVSLSEAFTSDADDEKEEGEGANRANEGSDDQPLGSPWAPLLSGLIYIVLFLGLSMFLFERYDF
ncbi:MAG TPA: ABC transporter permease [Pirellulaceae bacterium]|nr:ABC transporter permease [Pirellulaceae bacterium]